MNAKENALRIIRYDAPERIVSGPPCVGVQYFGCNHECLLTGGSHNEHKAGESWKDVWGTVWVKEMDGVMAFPRENPLARITAFNSYKWPDPNDESLYGMIFKGAEEIKENRLNEDKFLLGQNRDTLWERAYMLVGMENLMVYFYDEPAYVREILRRVMDFQLGMAKWYVEAGIEMAGLSDDLGTQRSLLLSPDILEEFFIPEYKRLFTYYKERGVLINFHSCGHIEPALGMFMDLGVDILNPVQATANDLSKIKKTARKRMALMGGISSGLVESGPPEAIARDVREKMALLGEGGGYFCRMDQGIPVPTEHMKTLYDTVEAYGRY